MATFFTVGRHCVVTSQPPNMRDPRRPHRILTQPDRPGVDQSKDLIRIQFKAILLGLSCAFFCLELVPHSCILAVSNEDSVLAYDVSLDAHGCVLWVMNHGDGCQMTTLDLAVRETARNILSFA